MPESLTCPQGRTALSLPMAPAILVHTPVHASWLNQIEINFSIVQRKVLTPNDFLSVAQLEQRLLDYQKERL